MEGDQQSSSKTTTRKRKFSISTDGDERESKIARIDDESSLIGASTNRNINQLPTELLMNIFKFLDTDARKSCSVACKRWLDIIFTKDFCKEFPLTFEFCHFSHNYEPMLTFSNTESRRFPYIKLATQIQIYDEPRTIDLFRKIGHSTTQLSISNDTPGSILQCFPNLQILEITELKKLLEINIPSSVHTIIADYDYTNLSDDFDSELCEHLKSLRQLKEVKCKKIWFDEQSQLQNSSEELKRSIEDNYGKELKITKNLLSDQQLSYQDVVGLEVIDEFHSFDDLRKFTNLQELEVSHETCLSFHQICKMDKVRTLNINNHYSDHCKICTSCFKSMLASFPNLDTIVLEYDVTAVNFLLICALHPSIKNLTIDVSNINENILFGDSGLKSLKQLKTLILIHKNRSNDPTIYNRYACFRWQMLSNWPSMPNLQELSLCAMTSAESENVEVRTQALQHLINQCPNVRHFYIKTVQLLLNEVAMITRGWPKLSTLGIEIIDDKISIPAICKNIFCKNLRKLHFKCSEGVFGLYDNEWQLNLFDKIGTLQRITHQKDSDLITRDISTRLMYYHRKAQREIARVQAKRIQIKLRLEQLGLPDSGDDDENERRIRAKQREDWTQIYQIVSNRVMSEEQRADLAAEYLKRMEEDKPI